MISAKLNAIKYAFAQFKMFSLSATVGESGWGALRVTPPEKTKIYGNAKKWHWRMQAMNAFYELCLRWLARLRGAFAFVCAINWNIQAADQVSNR